MPSPIPTISIYRSLSAGYEFCQVNGRLFERRLILDSNFRILGREEWVLLDLTRERVRVIREQADAQISDKSILYYWRALDACAWNATASTFKVQSPADQARAELQRARERAEAIEAREEREYAALASVDRIRSRAPALPNQTAALPPRQRRRR